MVLILPVCRITQGTLNKVSLTEPHLTPDKLELRQNYFWNPQVILVCSQEFRIPGLRFSFLFWPQDTIGNFSLSPLSIWSLVNPFPYLTHCGLCDYFILFIFFFGCLTMPLKLEKRSYVCIILYIFTYKFYVLSTRNLCRERQKM